jgi:ABC-type uncharacterized transport system permease subunit
MSDQTGQQPPVQTPPGAPEAGDGRQGRLRQFWADLVGINVDWRGAVLVPLLAVLTSVIIGALIIVVSDLDMWRQLGSSPGKALGDAGRLVANAYGALAEGAFGSGEAWSETLVAATPLILAGLCVAIGFRAGLFNIGGQGQVIVGGMASLIVGFSVHLPSFIHIPLALLAGIAAGALWGGIAGLLKARTGAHEVITTIMLNYIALFLLRWGLKTDFIRAVGRTDPISKPIDTSAQLPQLFGFLEGNTLRVHLGFIIALLAAWLTWWLLFRSTIGFEFRATGFNLHAAEYAGMKTSRLFILVMAIAGAMAGLAGAGQMLGVHGQAVDGFQGTYGFDAIALALLGRSHPAGVVVASLLFGALQAGGRIMQARTSVSIDLVLVVQALVIMFVAAPALIRAIYRVRTGEGAGQLTRGWGS